MVNNSPLNLNGNNMLSSDSEDDDYDPEAPVVEDEENSTDSEGTSDSGDDGDQSGGSDEDDDDESVLDMSSGDDTPRKVFQTRSSTSKATTSSATASTETSGSEPSSADNTFELAPERDMYQSEEYKIWKKNAPYLYDLLATHVLEWPSLTLEFLPEAVRPPNRDYTVHRLIVGTQTSDGHDNYLIIFRALLPELDPAQMNSSIEPSGHGGYTAKVESFIKIAHEGDVNRARSNPENNFLIATQTSTAKVLLFDFSKHSSEPDSSRTRICRPEVVLDGHTEEGYGLSWSTREPGHLVTCANDGLVCMWNVDAAQDKGRTIKPVDTFAGHEGSVGDVQFHHFHPDIFGSVGADRQIILWDKRARNEQIRVKEAHTGDINSISFNPFGEFPFLTASADQTVALWDIRNLGKNALTAFKGHRDEIYQVNWSPTHETVFASAGADHRVLVWDLRAHARVQTPAEKEENVPQSLMFIHGGHTEKVTDFAWSSTEPWLVGSVAENNCLHLWKMAEHCLFYKDE